MFRKHVSNFSSAYYHDELAPEESQRFAEHLIACSRCRLEFEEIKLGVKFAEQIELVSAPDSIWAGVAKGLGHKKAISMRLGFLKPLAIAASMVLLLGGGLLLVRIFTPAARPSWQVARLDGAPRINSRTIGDQGRLAVGQWLETDATSRAKLDVSNIGNVEIDPNTRVRLVESKVTEHRLELERGRLSARISAPPKLFFVNTPSGVAEDLGCAYTLEVDDDGNSLLHVTAGWVALQLTGRESKVPAGAACATRKGIGPGTPYFEDASEDFRSALTKVDFEGDLKSLHVVLTEARQRDAMTLWYLLSRVEPAGRLGVYERLAVLVPPPKGTNREGLLSLDRDMLDRWQDEIDKANGGLSRFSSLHSTSRVIWQGTLGAIHGLEGKR